MKKNLYLAIVVLLLAGVIGGTFYMRKSMQKDHLAAMQAYHKGDVDGAYAILENSWRLALEQPEGCPLVLSVFAEKKLIEKLEKAAKICLDRQSGVGIASEALAMSLHQQDRTTEARAILLDVAKKKQNDRVYGALGHLFALDKKMQEASEYYLLAIQFSESWTLWLDPVLNQHAIVSDKAFVTKLIENVIAHKPTVPWAEQKLIELTKIHKLSILQSQLEARIKVANEKKRENQIPEDTPHSPKKGV